MPRPMKQTQRGRPRLRLTYANVISTICLFVVLGGGAYAATRVRLPRNSVGTRQIRKGAIRTAKIRNGAVTGQKIDLSSLGAVPSAVRAAGATSADSATEASHARSADRASSATHADAADRAVLAQTATDAERLGGHPPGDYQMKLQHSCPDAAIQAIGQDGSVSCRDLVLPIRLNQNAGDPVNAVQLGPGLLLQSVCHDGGQVKVLFVNNGAIGASLNWFSSDGSTVSADGASIPAGGAKDVPFNGGRIEGQFVYSIGVNVTTVALHALDATTSCEVRGTAVLAAPTFD